MNYGKLRLLEKTHVVRDVLESYQHKNILEWELLEQDYAISWVLYGIAKTEPLSNHLVFKGGTCLRKSYFEKYRFSQDLEFSGEESCPIGADLETLFIKAMHQTNLEVYRRNYNMKFYIERYKGPSLKTQGSQESFTVFVSYPWHREPCVKIKIEVSLFENLLLEKRQNPLIHLYDEELPGVLYTYSLEEMMAMQILSFLCFNETIQTQGWTASKIKELYDLWFLVNLPSNSLDKKLVPEIVWKKCLEQKREFKMPNALFDSRLQANFEKSWDQWIDPLTIKQTDKETVLADLTKLFDKTFS